MNLYYFNESHLNYFTNKKDNNKELRNKFCIEPNNHFINCDSNIIYGNNRPINERCILITGQLNNDPNDNCSSIWNNLTKRKTLVKDKRI